MKNKTSWKCGFHKIIKNTTIHNFWNEKSHQWIKSLPKNLIWRNFGAFPQNEVFSEKSGFMGTLKTLTHGKFQKNAMSRFGEKL